MLDKVSVPVGVNGAAIQRVTEGPHPELLAPLTHQPFVEKLLFAPKSLYTVRTETIVPEKLIVADWDALSATRTVKL
jgi:hypothetical protein